LEQLDDDAGVQIIMLDDVSTDGSRAIAESLCKAYPKHLKLIYHNANQGLSAARNSLLEAAEGAHIWFVDSDDYLLPGAISGLRTILEKHNPDLILCDYRRNHFVKRRSFYGPTRQVSCDIGQLVTGVFKSRKMYSWIKISRRSMWDDGLRFPVGRIFEDIATTPWLLLRARNYYYVPSPWIFYRRRAGSIMHSFNLKTATFNAQKIAIWLRVWPVSRWRWMRSLADQNPKQSITYPISARINLPKLECALHVQRTFRRHWNSNIIGSFLKAVPQSRLIV
jgi:glycosyltransferase involved in cell wall biosynthesis